MNYALVPPRKIRIQLHRIWLPAAGAVNPKVTDLLCHKYLQSFNHQTSQAEDAGHRVQVLLSHLLSIYLSFQDGPASWTIAWWVSLCSKYFIVFISFVQFLVAIQGIMLNLDILRPVPGGTNQHYKARHTHKKVIEYRYTSDLIRLRIHLMWLHGSRKQEYIHL